VFFSATTPPSSQSAPTDSLPCHAVEGPTLARHECFSAKLYKMHKINGLILILVGYFEVRFVPGERTKVLKNIHLQGEPHSPICGVTQHGWTSRAFTFIR
jgi:hypothetical protein